MSFWKKLGGMLKSEAATVKEQSKDAAKVIIQNRIASAYTRFWQWFNGVKK